MCAKATKNFNYVMATDHVILTTEKLVDIAEHDADKFAGLDTGGYGLQAYNFSKPQTDGRGVE